MSKQGLKHTFKYYVDCARNKDCKRPPFHACSKKTSINTTFSRSPFLLFAGYLSFLTIARAEGLNQRIRLNTYFETDQGSRYLMLVERLTFSSLLCTNFLRFQARSLCLKTESRKEGVKKILDFLGWGGGASRPLFLIYTCKILKLKQKCCPFVG